MMNMPRGITRTGNPFHRVPLLFTTRDSEGKLVSFMPGGPRILDSRKQDVVICMTLDAENNEIPIPFMGGDIGVVEDMSGLSETPPDGLIAIVEKAELHTEGKRKFFPLEEVPAVFFPFELPLNGIFGISSIDFLNCTFGTRTGSLTVLFVEEADVLDVGLSGPVMLITNGSQEAADLVYIRTAQAGLLEGFQEVAIAVDAGWNKLVKTNNIWRQTPVAVSAIPAITDVTVEDSYVDSVANPFASDAEWVWITGLAYSLGGKWHVLDGKYAPLPFLAVLAEEDDDLQWQLAVIVNNVSLQRWKNGEYLEPTMLDWFKIFSASLTYSIRLRVNIPTSTAHTTGAIKAAIEAELTNFINTAFDNAAKITISSFSWAENAGDPYWDGTLVWEYPDLYEGSWTEPIARYGVRFYFDDNPTTGGN
jgi:hypothetical protein